VPGGRNRLEHNRNRAEFRDFSYADAVFLLSAIEKGANFKTSGRCKRHDSWHFSEFLAISD
jgi:hypothetical protein